jgi:hypothetical protein
MLFMVVERFRREDVPRIGERFARCGRMLPEGVAYLASWLEDGAGDIARCFQVMEAPDAAALKPWMECWEDLAQFEVVPVRTSAEFWAGRRGT